MNDELKTIESSCKSNKTCILIYSFTILVFFVISLFGSTLETLQVLITFFVASQLCVTVINQNKICGLLRKMIEEKEPASESSEKNR